MKVEPPDTHLFLCISSTGNYITNKNIKIVDPQSKVIEDLIEKINSTSNFTTVFVHYLDFQKAHFINRIKNYNVKIIWIIWSGDFYSLKKLKFNKYESYSKKIIKATEQSQMFSLKVFLGRLKLKYWDRIDLNKKQAETEIYKAIRRINGCATFLKEEVEILQRKLNIRIFHVPFAIVSADNETYTNQNNVKSKILLGHAADPANNHWEIIQQIKDFKIFDEVVIPLSYGENYYREALCRDVQKINSTIKIVFLQELLPKNEYYKLLSEAKVAIFGQNIQQAFGNIIALLLYGAKVFLKESNPLYLQFKDLGVKVFSIDSELKPENLQYSLDKEIVQKNIELLKKYLSQDAVLNYYKNLLAQ